MSFIDDEFISKPLSLHIYLCFLACSRWEPNPEDPEEWIIGTTSWCWCGLMPDKSPSSAHFSLCDAVAQWREVHHMSAFDLATPGIEGRCCVSLSSLFNERSCVDFCVIKLATKCGFYFTVLILRYPHRKEWGEICLKRITLFCCARILSWCDLSFFSFLIWFAFLRHCELNPELPHARWALYYRATATALSCQDSLYKIIRRECVMNIKLYILSWWNGSVKGIGCSTCWPGFDPCVSRGSKVELNPAGCPLTATFTQWWWTLCDKSKFSVSSKCKKP